MRILERFREFARGEEFVKVHGVNEPARGFIDIECRCRSFSGAAQKYLPDAIRQHGQNVRRAAQREEAEAHRRQGRQESSSQQKAGHDLRHKWDALPEPERRRIEQEVRVRVGCSLSAAFLLRLCLEELGRRQS